MLQLVTGRSGSGKTEYVRGLLGGLAQAGEDHLLLLVPEQYSFDTERAMLQRFGNRDAQRVEVLSFTRLADFVFRDLGGNAGLIADEGTRLILMLRAMDTVADKLEHYRKYTDDVRLAKELLSVFREVRQSGAALRKLEEAAGQVESPILSRKLNELFLIFDAYDALFRQRYSDEEMQLEKLCRALDEHRALEGYTLGIDGFKSFTGRELALLGRILSQAKDVYVTLCTDGPSPSMIFHSVNETKRRLERMAKERGVPVRLVPAEESGVRSGQRFLAPELAYLEEHLFYPGAPVYEDEAGHITLCESPTLFDECEWIAATARKLLREEGLRARDIAVIVRNEEDYRKELLAAFRRYDLPFFDDARQPVEHQPLVVLCRAVLTLLAAGFTSENLLQYMKTGLAGVTAAETDELENYVFTWDLKGRDWQQDFTWNPFGLDAAFRSDAEVEEALGLLNETRKRVIGPLLRLRREVKDAGYREVGEAFYRFLTGTGVPERLKEYAILLDTDGLPELAGEQDRVWDVVISVIDRLTAVYGDTPCPSMKTYADAFYAILSMTDLGNIPQGLDEITVASADRVRLSSPDTVFVAGLEEGVFPAVVGQSGLFTLRERAGLREQGLELSFPEDLRASEERFIAYSAVTAPRQRLYLSWHRLDAAGGSHFPSELFLQAKALFTEIDEETGEEMIHCKAVQSDALPVEYYAETEDAAFHAYADRRKAGLSGELRSLEQALLEQDTDGLWAGKLSGLERALGPHVYRIDDPAVATELFRKDMGLSASRVDSYYHCAFQYFCRYGLNAEPRRKATLGANHYGTIIHYVLEQLLKESDKETFVGLSEDALRARVDHWMAVYADGDLGGLDDKTTRFRYLYDRLKLTLYEVAGRLQDELRVSDFVPTDFELGIGKEDADVSPYTLDLPDGGTLSIWGSVDRVDLCERDGKTYVRVVDYKSGGKEFELSDVLFGLNLQMLLYLFTIEENGRGRYADTVPAGILYYPAKRTGGTVAARETPPEEADLQNRGRDAQNGLLLDDPAVLDAMEHDLEGRFLPVRWKRPKDGEPVLTPEKSLASLAELGQLRKRIDFLLRKMATDLHGGYIAACPAEQNGHLPCEYCDYYAVCRPEDPETRVIESYTRDELRAELEKEVSGDA